MDEFAEAKQLFFEYACSTFFMSRDGVDQTYYTFAVPKELERTWRAEYIAHWISCLDANNLEALQKLDNAHAVEALPEIMLFATQGDSYAQLWYANAIARLIKYDGVKRQLKREAHDLAVQIWQKLQNEPITIMPEHRRTIRKSLSAFNANNAEEYVRNYALAQLNRLQESCP